jgi:hypothetical protein
MNDRLFSTGKWPCQIPPPTECKSANTEILDKIRHSFSHDSQQWSWPSNKGKRPRSESNSSSVSSSYSSYSGTGSSNRRARKDERFGGDRRERGGDRGDRREPSFVPGFFRGGSRGSSRGGPRGGQQDGSKRGNYDSRSRGYSGYSGYWSPDHLNGSQSIFCFLYKKKLHLFAQKPVKKLFRNFFWCRGVRGWSSAHYHNKRRRRSWPDTAICIAYAYKLQRKSKERYRQVVSDIPFFQGMSSLCRL